jgi:hypothetical protein
MSKKKVIHTCPSIGSHDLAYEIITFGGKNKNLGIIYVLQKSLVQKNYQIEHLIELDKTNDVLGQNGQQFCNQTKHPRIISKSS